jgi:hypothetical protein
MKYQIQEVERIALAERMLAERASTILEKLVREVAATCEISIQEMVIKLRPDLDASPEPAMHIVVTAAEVTNVNRDRSTRGSGDFCAYPLNVRSLARRQ